jgi:hypothetical protein
VLRLAKAGPISRAVEVIIAFNHDGACSRNAVYGWARRAYSSVPLERRASVVMRVIEYIASRLIARIVSDNKDYTQKLESGIRFCQNAPSF